MGKNKMSRMFRILAILALVAVLSSANLSAAYQGNNYDIMLQGFHWLSANGSWWSTISSKAQEIKDAGFTMVWLPPMSKAASKEGYLPTQWYNLASNYGSQSALQNAIAQLKNRGIKPIADIVINHRCGTTNWADFSDPSFANNNYAVCSNDEFFAPGNPGAGVSQRGAYDTGEGYAAGRDLDHTNSSVQTEIKAWMNWLKNTIGFEGWRYDFVKGFSGYYVGEYNMATSPYFSVGEFWPTNYFDANNPNNWRQQIINWIDATGGRSTAFDFVTKPLLAQAFNHNEYWRLRDSEGKPTGTIGWWPEMSVTFIDNHDTGPSPGGGQNHWPFPSNNVAAGYAYILTHPGIPCVYWPHYFDWGSSLQNQIKSMIAIRKAQGIHSKSSVSIQAADSSKYAAIIDNKVVVKIGHGAWSPSGNWTLALSGTNFAIWTAGSGGGGSAPAAPTNLTATAASSSSINLSWNASSGADSYTVYRSTSSNGTYTSIGTTSNTNFTSTGLTANTTYYYRVTATNAYGTSGYSNTASATTPATGSGLKVHFKNNAVTNWSSFRCYYWGSNGSPSSNSWPGQAMTAEGNGWYVFTIPGATSSNVIFNNGTGSQTVDLSRSGEGWFVPTGTSGGKITGTWYSSNPDEGGSAPAAPANLTATAASSSTINLSWNASSGADSYTVYRSTSSNGTYTSIGTTSNTNFTSTGLTAGTTYYYRVTASNTYGTSRYSNTASATTQSGGGTVTTTIRVQYDVGFGNNMYIRGDISPLSWSKGIAMTWTSGNVWVYTTTEIPAGQTFEFKPLINDSTWSSGSNYQGTGGQTITITPSF